MFLISNEVYGSEILRQGFSGYVTEVLIYNFKSFVNSIKSLSKLQEFQIIGNTNKKFTTPITIIDPIDSNRKLSFSCFSRKFRKNDVNLQGIFE